MNRHPRTSVGDIGRVAREQPDPDVHVSARVERVEVKDVRYFVQCTSCGESNRLLNVKAICRAEAGLSVSLRCANTNCRQLMHGRMGEKDEESKPKLSVLRDR
jgi:hypothetical protein